MPNWTKEQELAINKEGSNIIVSAGAGSGKTAVLTARVLRKLNSHININNLLILTFTNKAAFEMKDRIRKEISKNKNLIKQLDYIDSSYITTFDSFALSIVKRYSYLLNKSKDIKIIDSAIIYLEKKKIIDNIFDRLYQEKNNKFFKLLNDFTIKNDDDIKKYILDVNDKLDLKYDKRDYLNNYIDNYYSDSSFKLLFDSYEDLLRCKINEIDKFLNLLDTYVESDYLEQLYSSFSNLLNSKTYFEVKNNIDFKVPMLPRNSDEYAKDIKDNIIKMLDSIKELVRFDSIDDLKETFFSTKDYVEIIIDIILELDFEINKVKDSINAYEFIDISKLAIKIVEENENIKEEIKNNFNEIMIDEYQDTSDLQEKFISIIENNNVYMVGDIKQSIYRFRNANPYLFKNKYDNYSNNYGGFKIDLTKNFRSRNEVINNINLLFSNTMTDSYGGADYAKSHRMIYGNDIYLKEGKTNQLYDFEIFNYEYDKDCLYSKEEIEIFTIAKDIKDKVNNKYQIFDKDLKKLRNSNYGDFAILLDKTTNFDLIKKIFQYFNIPVTKYTSTNITTEIELVLIKNILKLIINRKNNCYDVDFKYAFVSIARSYLFEYSDQSIFDFIANNNYSCSLMDNIDLIVNNIDNLSVKEIIYEIINTFNFYEKVIFVGDVKNRINRLTSIIDIFDNLASLSYSIYDVYNYLERLIDDEYKIEVKELDAIQNSVKLITIHGSKGLEFPICYFAILHSKFNIRDLNEKIMFDNKYGIITPYYKEGIGKTFVKELVKDMYLKEEVSEKIRLFYVALTRAKEKFIIVTSLKEKSINSIENVRSFLDLLTYNSSIIKPYIKTISLNSIGLSKDYNYVKKSNYKDIIEKSKDKININEISVDNFEMNNEKISKEIYNLLDKKSKEKMKFGTYLHEVLELIDFKNPNFNNINIDKYYQSKILDFISKIDISNVINIYKEYEFVYQDNDNKYHGIIDLILEYKDYIMIVDYKLKNINDSNYIKQLSEYKKYMSFKTNKKIDVYLFSILSGSFEKIF